MIKQSAKHVFFYTEWPSNFFQTSFTYDYNDEGDPKHFFCTEQAFMYCKARFFNDISTANKILHAQNPARAKHLGREVRNYVDSKWDKVRYEFMKQVNLERFRQDVALKTRLLNPEYDGKTFVEASPVDCIWGIGLGLDHPFLANENHWRGKNLLGKALTEVREIIKSEERTA